MSGKRGADDAGGGVLGVRAVEVELRPVAVVLDRRLRRVRAEIAMDLILTA